MLSFLGSHILISESSSPFLPLHFFITSYSWHCLNCSLFGSIPSSSFSFGVWRLTSCCHHLLSTVSDCNFFPTSPHHLLSVILVVTSCCDSPSPVRLHHIPPLFPVIISHRNWFLVISCSNFPLSYPVAISSSPFLHRHFMLQCLKTFSHRFSFPSCLHRCFCRFPLSHCLCSNLFSAASVHPDVCYLSIFLSLRPFILSHSFPSPAAPRFFLNFKDWLSNWLSFDDLKLLMFCFNNYSFAASCPRFDTFGVSTKLAEYLPKTLMLTSRWVLWSLHLKQQSITLKAESFINISKHLPPLIHFTIFLIQFITLPFSSNFFHVYMVYIVH